MSRLRTRVGIYFLCDQIEEVDGDDSRDSSIFF